MQRTPSDNGESTRGGGTSSSQPGTSTSSSSRSTSPRFPITRIEAADRAEWQSSTIGRNFNPETSTSATNDSTQSSTPTTSAPPPRAYHSLNYAPRQRTSLRPNTASIFQSHSSQLSQAAPSPSYPTISLPDAAAPPPRDSSHNDTAVALAKIQLQQIQDEARRLGLNDKSAGWLILEALQAATEGEWASVAELLANGEATLLLPRDAPSIFTSSNQISASFAYDHTLFAVSTKQESAALTLSGLRGTLLPTSEQGEAELVMQSFVTKPNSNLKDATIRQEVMEWLAPLPHLAEVEGVKYPSFKLRERNTAFPLPLSINASKQNGQGGRARSNSKFNAAGSRASASFASIFGGSGRERRRQQLQAGTVEEEMVNAQRLSPNAATPQENSDTETSSTLGLDISESARSQSSIEAKEKGRRTISVWVVDHLVRRSSVMRGIRKTLDARIKARLAQKGIEEDVREVVAVFAGAFLPPIDSVRSGGGGGHRGNSPVNVANPLYLVEAENLASIFQDLFLSVRDQLDKMHTSATGQGEEEEQEAAKEIDAKLETIEAVLCEEVYDRIFNPTTSKDSFRDDALSSRIAALNLLGLSMRHLGLDLPEPSSTGAKKVVLDELEALVSACGTELAKLQHRHSPKDKLDVLIQSHKVLVEGLATLPKIRLVDTTDENQAAEGKEGGERTSADLILPILIYSIVRSNPARLASNLLYVQRFRGVPLVRGEGSYCLVNVQAAVAFLQGVDVKHLGLDAGVIGGPLKVDDAEKECKGSQGVEGVKEAGGGGTGGGGTGGRGLLRGRVAQEIGELAAGVMGSGVGVWGRRMMGAYPPPAPPANGGDTAAISTESTGTSRPTLRSTTSSNSTLPNVKATDYTDIGEQTKDIASTPTEGKPSIGDRLASLSMLSRLGSSPSSTSLGIGIGIGIGLGHPSDATTSTTTSSAPPSIASPRIVSRELPGPPPPSKPQMGRTTSYLAAQLNRITGTPRSASSTFLAPAVAITTEERRRAEERELPASLRSPYPPLSKPPSEDRPLHVVLVSTGSVASVKVPLMVEELLRYRGVRVMVVATDNSLHFYDKERIQELNRDYSSQAEADEVYGVADLAAENLAASRNSSPSEHLPRAKVWTNTDEWTSFTKIGDPILHIQLRRWADIVLVAPCSANTLAKLNAGICDDLVTSFLRALPQPTTSDSPSVVLFPAMNTLMYLHPLTSLHLATVRQVLGYEVMPPIEKKLACGDLGTGAMVEWSDIVGLVVDRFGLVKLEQIQTRNEEEVKEERV
ncbi:related to Phosphopantothenoylcysteine decarboxylase [Ustilago sp. UG-2017b]|nr:related to Phosphopantothenoylcysteine decarboxylase [Ustilago sp. UG-2017b]